MHKACTKLLSKTKQGTICYLNASDSTFWEKMFLQFLSLVLNLTSTEVTHKIVIASSVYVTLSYAFRKQMDYRSLDKQFS